MNEEAIREKVNGVIDAIAREDKEAALARLKDVLTEFIVTTARATEAMERFAAAAEKIAERMPNE